MIEIKDEISLISKERIADLKPDDREILELLQYMAAADIHIRFDVGGTVLSSLDEGVLRHIKKSIHLVDPPEFNSKIDYRKELWKGFLMNEILCKTFRDEAVDTVIAQQQVNEYDKIYGELEGQVRSKKKNRRPAAEITKAFLVFFKLIPSAPIKLVANAMGGRLP